MPLILNLPVHNFVPGLVSCSSTLSFYFRLIFSINNIDGFQLTIFADTEVLSMHSVNMHNLCDLFASIGFYLVLQNIE